MLKNQLQTNSKLTRFQRVRLWLLWYLCRGFALLPYWFRYYVVENVIFFILYYCLRYRMKVVRQNLANSFPEKSKFELLVIRRKFYYTLSEMFVNTLSIVGMSDRRVRKVVWFRNVEQHLALTEGRDWIALMAHFGCWEYGPFWSVYAPKQSLVSVYHPLRSVVIDEFFKRLRSHRHSIPVPMNDCLRFYLRHRQTGCDGRRMALGLIADQNPPRRPDSHWFRFLNQDTIFFEGSEKLALRCGLPVYFTHMNRVRRGCYEVTFELLYDGVESVAENEITERYVRRLELMIRERPELWMWSHRRWKHKRDES